jgi:ABC-type uncharacterized transport system permease subunit
MAVERQVSWGNVVLGVLAAVVPGFLVTVASTFGGMLASEKWNSRVLGIAIAVIVPGLVVLALYALVRRRAPDFARGVLIGLCLVILWAGLCGGNFVGARIGG